jgi:hypothetical protein
MWMGLGSLATFTFDGCGKAANAIDCDDGNVAVQSEPPIPGFVPSHRPRRLRSLTVIRQNPFAGSGEPVPMLLKAGQHCEIALIEHWAAVPMDIARAGTPLLWGANVLRHRDT